MSIKMARLSCGKSVDMTYLEHRLDKAFRAQDLDVGEIISIENMIVESSDDLEPLE